MNKVIPGTILITRYRSRVEAVTSPDNNGWLQVKRLTDGAIREWNIADMTVETVTPITPEATPVATDTPLLTKLQELPVVGVLNVDNPNDPRHKDWKL